MYSSVPSCVPLLQLFQLGHESPVSRYFPRFRISLVFFILFYTCNILHNASVSTYLLRICTVTSISCIIISTEFPPVAPASVISGSVSDLSLGKFNYSQGELLFVIISVENRIFIQVKNLT